MLCSLTQLGIRMLPSAALGILSSPRIAPRSLKPQSDGCLANLQKELFLFCLHTANLVPIELVLAACWQQAVLIIAYKKFKRVKFNVDLQTLVYIGGILMLSV